MASSSSSDEEPLAVPRASDLGRRLAAAAEDHARSWEASVPRQISAAVTREFDIPIPLAVPHEAIVRQTRALRAAGYTVTVTNEHRQPVYVPETDNESWLAKAHWYAINYRCEHVPADRQGNMRVAIPPEHGPEPQQDAYFEDHLLKIPRLALMLLFLLCLFPVISHIPLEAATSKICVLVNALIFSIFTLRDARWEMRLKDAEEKNKGCKFAQY